MDADNHTSSSETEQEQETTPAAIAGAPSAGALLRAYREEAGMEQETLAAALKINAQKLQALESDDYSVLPALYFARGLAANICRHLKRDPAPVLARMPDEKLHIPAAEKTDTTPMQPMVPVSIGTSSSNNLLKWIIAAAVLLALIVGAVFAIPAIRARLAGSTHQTSSAADNATTAPSGTTPNASSATLTAAPTPAAAPLTLQPAAIEPAVPASAAADASHTLQLHASGNTWVKISSTKGKTLFEGNLKAGDQQSLAVAEYPVRVIIGKAENVQVIDRGQTFDLASVAARGTARFELKP